VGNLTQTCISI